MILVITSNEDQITADFRPLIVILFLLYLPIFKRSMNESIWSALLNILKTSSPSIGDVAAESMFELRELRVFRNLRDVAASVPIVPTVPKS